MAFGHADDPKPLAEIRPKPCLVVGTHEAEQLFVPLDASGVKGCFEESRRDALTMTIEGDIRSDDTDVIECVRVVGEGRNVLKPDDRAGRGVDRDEKYSALGKAADERALFVDRHRRVERRVDSGGDNRIEYHRYAFGVIPARVTNDHGVHRDH